MTVERPAVLLRRTAAAIFQGATLREVPDGWEVVKDGEVLGRFSRSKRWLRSDRGEVKEIPSKRIWELGLLQWYGLRLPKAAPRPQRSTPRPKREAPVVSLPTRPSLQDAIEEAALVNLGRDWVTVERLEDVLDLYGLTLRAALYHGYIRIVDKHPGQPRMGRDWDGYRALQVDVVKEPP